MIRAGVMRRFPFGAVGLCCVASLAVSLVAAGCGSQDRSSSSPSDAGGDSAARGSSDSGAHGDSCPVDSDCAEPADGVSDAASATTEEAAVADEAATTDASEPESGSGGPVDGSDVMQTSEAYVSATLGPHRDGDGNNLCSFGTPTQGLRIGTTGSEPLVAVDGSMQSGAVVNLSCTVAAGFHVNLVASLGGESGGTLSVSGDVDPASGGTGIVADIVSAVDGEFSQSDCTITFTYVGQPVPVSPPIDQGRIWAHLSCPAMVNTSGATVRLMDGTTSPETCDVEVDFEFENCGS